MKVKQTFRLRGNAMSYVQVLDQVRRWHVQYTLEQEDDTINNHTYKDEQKLLELVRMGDVDTVRSVTEYGCPDYPQIISYSEKKTEEYMAVVSVALIARAAIEGGVSSAESFALSDVYLKKLACASDVRDILDIRSSVAVAYTEMVAARRTPKKSGGYIEECKSYIASNVFKKISVSDVAQSLSLNAIYLERIFKESEGITIGQYIQKEKIGRAKNLLVYSDRSILEISEYLSFNSQSHFGKVFKQETGMTPRQYRQVNRLTGF